MSDGILSPAPSHLVGRLVRADRVLVAARLRTSVRITSQGSPYARFQRALKTGRASVAWNAARELEHVDLQDALSLVLLVVDDPRFDRASARWLGRLCLEVPSLTLRQAQLAAAGLTGLPDRAAAIALATSCSELGLQHAAAATRAAYL